MTLNTSAISNAAISELAAAVQGAAAPAGSDDGNSHPPLCHQSRAEERLHDATASVLAGTQQLFPGEVKMEPVVDPEISGSRYLTVSCRSNQSVEEIMCAFDRWHEKLTAWVPGLEHVFRLSVDAIE